ncbi:hypothetical protein ACF1AJ_20380 [Leifsonia sp. NPDC014704]|uniref:hypothetical protein n=1 Tax=Leifsonia sp. NPDC014704 TaxID=3364123 RepID=UPI0036F45714
MKTYDVTVTREGKWWMVAIPELDGLTQARRLSEVPEMAREYIAVTEDIPLEEVDVVVTFDRIGGVVELHQALDTVRDFREAAMLLNEAASHISSQLAKRLSDEGLTVRDVGTVLGVSHQRAQQILSAPTPREINLNEIRVLSSMDALLGGIGDLGEPQRHVILEPLDRTPAPQDIVDRHRVRPS